jgi:hypothetical protein
MNYSTSDRTSKSASRWDEGIHRIQILEKEAIRRDRQLSQRSLSQSKVQTSPMEGIATRLWRRNKSHWQGTRRRRYQFLRSPSARRKKPVACNAVIKSYDPKIRLCRDDRIDLQNCSAFQRTRIHKLGRKVSPKTKSS